MPNIDKAVKVGAVFKNGAIHPAWFVWDGRRYGVKEVNYTWRMSKGLAEIHFFSVSDGINSFELSFNAREMTWTLTKVHS